MSLADVLRAPVEARGTALCHVAVLLDGLEPDDRVAVEEVMALPMVEYPSTILARRLTDAGHKMTAGPLQRHRRGDCKCPH